MESPLNSVINWPFFSMKRSICSQNISNKDGDGVPNMISRSDHLHGEASLRKTKQAASMELKERLDLFVDCLTRGPRAPKSPAILPTSALLNLKFDKHSSSLIELMLKEEARMRADLRADLKNSSLASRAFRAKEAFK